MKKTFREYLLDGTSNRKEFHVVKTKSGRTFVKYDEMEIGISGAGAYIVYRYKGREIDRNHYEDFSAEILDGDPIVLKNLTGFYEFKIG